MAIKLGQTYGSKKATVFANSMYYKPALKKVVIRHPGVLRRSERVLDRNRRVATAKPAAKCGGTKENPKPLSEFLACLSEEMKRV